MPSPAARAQALQCGTPGQGSGRRRGQTFAAVPDFEFETSDLYVRGERATVRWRVRGTFSGQSFDGIEPNGARVDVEGVDLVTVHDGKLVDLDAFVNYADFARQLGVL